jgi:hypothetical protein
VGAHPCFLIPRHEDVCGSRGTAPCIIWRSVISFTPWPLYPLGKSRHYPMNTRLSEPESRSGRGGGWIGNRTPILNTCTLTQQPGYLNKPHIWIRTVKQKQKYGSNLIWWHIYSSIYIKTNTKTLRIFHLGDRYLETKQIVARGGNYCSTNTEKQKSPADHYSRIP